MGPLFATFVLIVRGGSAITTELGIMKAGGEVRVLEARSIEPLLFLVMPRALGMAVSAFCFTVIFVLVAFASGYGFGVFIGQANVNPAVFLNGLFKAVHPWDGISFLVKCLLPALLTSVIYSTEGLSVEGTRVRKLPGVVPMILRGKAFEPFMSVEINLQPPRRLTAHFDESLAPVGVIEVEVVIISVRRETHLTWICRHFL